MKKTLNIFAQFSEDAIIEAICKDAGIKPKFTVEIGAGDGWSMSTTRRFRQQGAKGIMIDYGFDSPDVIKTKVSASNIGQILTDAKCPKEFDILSIDIDGQDYWVLRSILFEFSPSVICAEVNGTQDQTKEISVRLDDGMAWDGSNYYGATLAAFCKLGKYFGYTVVYHHLSMNVYLIKDSFGMPEYLDLMPTHTYHPADKLGREWVNV